MYNIKMSRKQFQAGAAFVALCFTMASFQNCSKVQFSDVPVTQKSLETIQSTDEYVCSAFDSNQSTNKTEGLKVELRYLKQNTNLSVEQKNSFLSTDYFNDQDSRFTKMNETIYLSEVNVPTRSFTSGFQNTSGGILKDNQGQILNEYFALKMESNLKLDANDAVGYYELSTISDDGTVIQIRQNNQWTTILNNDGSHAPRMGCMSTKVYLDANTRIPIRIYYNQGPRTLIANVLLKNYRGENSTSGASVATDSDIHSLCGKSSQDQFYDPQSSQPKAYSQTLSNHGWQVLSSGNFELLDNQVNPCVAGK